MRFSLLLMAVGLLAATPLHADDSPLPELPVLSEAETATAIARAESLGRSLFLQDLAAERATDALVARQKGFRKDKRVRGWITEARGDEVVVSIIDATPAVLYRVRVNAEGAVLGDPEVLATPAALTAFETGAAQARMAAMSTRVQACAATYNSVVLPVGEDHRTWDVYLLPGTTQHEVVPLGGSYRLEVRDGKVTANRPFTRSCIQLQRGPNIAGMMVTHMLDPTPTEVHVYWSLWARTPMFVATRDDTTWKIEQGRISRVEEEPEAAPQPAH